MVWITKKIEVYGRWLQKHPEALHVTLLAVIFLFLDFEYRHFVAPYFFNLNFTYVYQPEKLVASLGLLLLIFASLTWMKTSGYLHLTSILFILFLLMPNLILYQYTQTPFFISLSVFLFILLLRLRINLTGIVRWIPVLPTKLSYAVLIALAAIFLAPIIFSFGFHLKDMAISLTGTSAQYAIRESVNIHMGTLNAYGFGQLTKAILPVLLLAGIINKKYLIALATLLAMLYLFLVNPHKTFLIVILPILFFIILRKYHQKASLFLALFIILLIAAKISTHYGSIMMESLLVRRTLFTQAYLTGAYFDFFHQDPLFLSQSIFGRWFHYPYELPPPFLIGEHYFQAPGMSCNTGFIGDGFMNFGHPGVILFIAGAALVFHLINNLQPAPRYYGLTFLIIFQMINSPLLTLFITHGLLLLLLIMMFLLRRHAGTPVPLR